MRTNPTLMIRYAARGNWALGIDRNVAGWLSSAEQVELSRLSHAARRAQWLQGRYLAKCLLANALQCRNHATIEILTRNADNLGTCPRIRIDAAKCNWSLSISHTDEGVLVGLATDSRMRVGVDLTRDGPASVHLQQTWFTPDERYWLEQQRGRQSTTLWALKEALFKAGNTGEPWTPQQVEVLPSCDGRYRCNFFGRPLCPQRVRLQHIGPHVAAAVCLSRRWNETSTTHNHNVTLCL